MSFCNSYNPSTTLFTMRSTNSMTQSITKSTESITSSTISLTVFITSSTLESSDSYGLTHPFVIFLLIFIFIFNIILFILFIDLILYYLKSMKNKVSQEKCFH